MNYRRDYHFRFLHSNESSLFHNCFRRRGHAFTILIIVAQDYLKRQKSLTYKWVIGYFSEFHEIFARFYVKVDYFILSAEVICCKINTLNRKSNKKCRVVQRILGGSKNFCSQTLNPNATTTSPQGNLTTIKYWIWDTPTKFPEWHKGHGRERKGSILPFFVHIIDTKPGSYWMK